MPFLTLDIRKWIVQAFVMDVDTVLMAELLKKYYPRFVEMHNYNAGNSIVKKVDNWHLLNRKVLSKLGLKLENETIDRLARSELGVIENVLISLRNKMIRDCNNERTNMHEDGHGGEKISNKYKVMFNFTNKNKLDL